MKKPNITTNNILWGVYVALLAVLLPHTAWAFSRFEPPGALGNVIAWAAAFAFEAAIATLTHKLAKHIEAVRRGKHLFVRRYLNAYSAGLLVAVGVSTAANLAHAIEFGQRIAIFDSGTALPAIYSVAFGAVLPLTSLVFARVLSNVADAEVEQDEELVAAKAEAKDLRRRLKDTAALVAENERRADDAEQRLGIAGDLFTRLFAEQVRVRIAAVAEAFPKLQPATIAKVADASPSYVSQVLNSE